MVNERIKLIRSEAGLSQAAFGKELGVSRDVINNLELGRVEPKDSMIKLICFTYHVNESWLRTGYGTKCVIEETSFPVDAIAQKYELSELETYLVKGYLNLNKKQRDEFLAAISNIIDYVNDCQQIKFVETLPAKEEANLLRQEADIIERSQGKR